MSLSSRTDWLYGLRPTIHRWIGEQCQDKCERFADRKPTKGKPLLLAPVGWTEAYADLTLAFGLALTGSGPSVCRQLVDGARQRLDLNDRAHSFLVRAYNCRIQQALDGRAGTGALSAELLEELAQLDLTFEGRTQAYAIDRLRSRSEILEPDGGVSPYRQFTARIKGAASDPSQLCDIASPVELAERIRGLIENCAGRPAVERASVLRRCLELSPRFEQGQAVEFLDRVAPLLADLSDPSEQALLTASALSAAAKFRQVGHVRQFVALLRDQRNAPAAPGWDGVWKRSIAALRRMGLREELDQFLSELAVAILGNVGVADLWKQLLDALVNDPQIDPNDRMAPMRSLLYVAGGWLDLGKIEQSDPVLDETRELLQENDLRSSTKTRVACAYARTLGRIPGDDGQRRAEDLFQWLGGVYDTYSTGARYALAPLMFVEALVLGMTAESCLMMPFPAPSA
jgi:hypothetical protein